MESLPEILIVDADADHRRLVRHALQGVGQIETAGTGEEAWALAQASDPRIVIADQRLPGIPGVELLHRVAERDAHVGRVLLTNYGDTQVTIEAVDRRRVDAYLAKPCLPHQLRLTIESLLERTRLERENARLFKDLLVKNQELRDAMRSLRTAQKRVLDSERLSAIGRTVAMIVHDFRGPLTGIRSANGEIAGGERDGEALRRLAAEISDEVERMSRMCSELLEVTRASGGPIQQSEVALDELVEDALALVAEDAGIAGVRLDVAPDSGATLLLDRERMRRALLNLAYNAIEAMPEGGELRVRTERSDDAVTLVIEDSGPGVPDEIRATLFDPFVTHGKSDGSGLGLAVVKKVVEDHGGSIEIAKPECGGTAFRIHLPGFLGS